MTEPARQPTFASNWDRLAYLLAAYKFLVTGLILGVSGLLLYVSPELPDPPEWGKAYVVAWLLFAIPCYVAGLFIVRWLRKRRWHTVFHINSVTDEREKYLVPPSVWDEKTVDGPAPFPVNDSDDYEVREFEWLEDIEELRVRGTWMSAAKDSELVTSRHHMRRIHNGLLEKAEKLAKLRGEWSEKSIEQQEKQINATAEARERGQMMDASAVKSTWEDMRGRLDDTDDLLPADTRDLAHDEREQARTNGHQEGSDHE